jgi:hypothetical protein
MSFGQPYINVPNRSRRRRAERLGWTERWEIHDGEGEECVIVTWEEEQEWDENERKKKASDRRERRNSVRHIRGPRR